MKRFAISIAALMLGQCPAHAQNAPNFSGKQITMVIGSAPGGGTDLSGRLIASFVSSYLPGKPTTIIRNMPGAQGVTAMNYFSKQVQPDGMTIVMGSTTQADPLFYRKPASQYDPTKFNVVGGIGRGGTVLMIRKDAEARLYDKKQPPVIMGSLGGLPRSGMQTTAWGIEFLGWNAKWVVGYSSTTELLLALERGEIDMTADGNMAYIRKLLDSGKFKIISQSGAIRNGKLIGRAEFEGAPFFQDLITGEIKDPTQQQAFRYWSSLTAMDKWFALPAATPDAYVKAYRAAFVAAGNDPEFAEKGRNVSEDFEPMSHDDVAFLMESLGNTPGPAIDFISSMLEKQGLKSE